MNPIYLDYNATTPLHDRVVEAMLPYMRDHFGNPSSSHHYGTVAKRAIENARRQVAGAIGARPEEVIFTSGGTESNNQALVGIAHSRKDDGRHIIISSVEHPAVSEVAAWLEREGFDVDRLDVDAYGRVHPDDLRKALKPATILVSVMHANNEVGTVQPIAALSAIAHELGASFHTDAAQSVGKIPVDVDELGVDLLSIAGHKLYAPKGVGALYIRSGTALEPLMRGADHEFGRRPGTENVIEIVGLGAACELLSEHLAENATGLRERRDQLYSRLSEALGETAIRLNGHPEDRLPNTLSVSFHDVDATALLAEIGEKVAASAGAACHAEGVDVSQVLEAMRVPTDWAMGTLRLSVGLGTTEDEIEAAADTIARAVTRLQPDAAASEDAGQSEETFNLTRFTHGMGCACKIPARILEEVLDRLPTPKGPEILVASRTADDAAAYRISDDLAIVQTVDFFTPVVDDPYDFGAISAANSLSDVYAMGADPLFALNIVAFPTQRLPVAALEQILLGAADKAAEAGIQIVGGHTIEDNEPKFGLAVTGTVHPDRIIRNSTAMPGDVLILTKPVGTGIATTAAKRGLAEDRLMASAVKLMSDLNLVASQAMKDAQASACTDVTGFGLLGHLRELARASKVDVQIESRRVPVLEGVRELAAADVVPGGSRQNLDFVTPHVHFSGSVSLADQLILADAQTSGGLLVTVPESNVDGFLAAVQGAVVIGRITLEGDGRIQVN